MRQIVTSEHVRSAGQALEPGALLVKAFETEVKAADGDRRWRFTITTGNPDRERDVIAPDGWQLEGFMRNPTVLWAHDYTMPPIGVARTMERVENALVSVAELVDPAAYPLAGTIAALLKLGALRATSVGFRPLTWNYNEERKGVDYLTQELLEYSIVPVPANAECLVEARAAGLDVEPLREWAAKALERFAAPEPALLDVSAVRYVRAVLDAAGRPTNVFYSAPAPAGDPVSGQSAETAAPPADPPAEATAKAKQPEHDPEDCDEGGCPMRGTDGEVADCTHSGCPMQKRARGTQKGAVPKGYAGYETVAHTQPAKGTTSPEHVHDYALWVYTTSAGVTTFDGGRAFDVADHGHRITETSLSRGETTESDGHAHRLMAVSAALVGEVIQIPAAAEPGAQKGVSPPSPADYGVAEEGAAWSAPTLEDFTRKQWENLDEADRRRVARHFAWSRTMPPELFGDLKLPHHRAGDGDVVWSACRAAMGALMGARGGVEIPEEDRPRVYRHLAAHYREFDREPPEMRAYAPEELAALWPAPRTAKVGAIGEVELDWLLSDAEREFDLEALLVGGAADAELTTEEIAQALREALPALVERAVGGAISRARGRLD